MATISAGDIDLTTQLDIVECEAIEATDQSATQSTAFRRPISVYSGAPLNLGIGNLTVPGGNSFEPDDGIFFPNGPIAYSRLLDLDKADQAIRIGGNAGGPNSPTIIDFFLHYDFMEIKEDSLLSVANVEIQFDVKNEYTTSDFGPSYDYNNWSNETHPTIRVGELEDYPTNLYDEVTTTTNSRQTLTATLTPTGLPKQHGFFVRIIGVQNQSGYASLKLDVYSIKARVNYTGKTNLKTGFIKKTGAVSLISSEYQGTTAKYNFANKITTDTGYSIAGVGVKYGFATLTQKTVGPPAGFEFNASKQLPSGSRVSIQNTTYSANVKYIDSDLQSSLFTIGGVRDTYYNTANTAVITEDNVNLYYALDEDNTLGFSIADARDANLAIHMNLHGTDNVNDYIRWSPEFFDDDYTVTSGGDIEAQIQWAVRPPLITGDITLSSSISVDDFAIKQTHGIVASEFDDISFSADTGSTLGGFKIQVESDVATAFDQTAEARIRVRADVEALSTEMDLENTGLAGLIRSGYTIDPSFSISWADTLANNSIVPDVYFPAIPEGYFLNQAAQIMTGVFDFAATGLYGVLYDMPAGRVGTYTTDFDTEASAFIYTDPSEARTFRPFYSRRFVFTEIADPKRHLHLDPQTRVISFDTVKDPKEYTVYGSLKTSALRIHTVEAETRILDMRGTGD